MCRALNYYEHFPIFISTISGCVSISKFTSLVGVPVRIASSTVGSKIYAIAAGIKRYKSIIKKEKNMHNEIMLLAKTKLNTFKVLISKALIPSYINHDELVSVNNVLWGQNAMKEEIKNSKMLWNILYKNNENYCVSCKENTVNENYSVSRTKQNTLMLVSNCAVCSKKKLRFIK